jgi:hypothetical protein
MNKTRVCGQVLLHKNTANQVSVVQNGVNKTYFSKTSDGGHYLETIVIKSGRTLFWTKNEIWGRRRPAEEPLWKGPLLDKKGRCVVSLTYQSAAFAGFAPIFPLLPVECVVWRCVWKGKRAWKVGGRKHRFRMMRVRTRFSFTEWGNCAQWFCVQNSPY